MPSIALRTDSVSSWVEKTDHNPLPQLLHTPSGLAIVEIQGTIHGPFPTSADDHDPTGSTGVTQIGRLEFPLYRSGEPGEGKWMKKVYLYVGKHQRLTGEVKKLAKPMAVIRKIEDEEGSTNDPSENQLIEELEVVDIVKFKLLFSGRPEPVGE